MTENPVPNHARTDGSTKKDTIVPKLSELAPGDVVEFADIRELAAFEDLIAAEVDPKHEPEVWAARTKLRDLIRPPHFNGTIADIKLVVMADPYERLLDAYERGWKGQRGNSLGRSHELSSELAESLIPRYRGFILTATPKSSRPGELGQIQAELWYFPVPPGVRKGSYVVSSGEVKKTSWLENRGLVEGIAIRRAVTQPRIERELFFQADADAKRVGFQVLQKSMMRPLSTPMRD